MKHTVERHRHVGFIEESGICGMLTRRDAFGQALTVVMHIAQCIRNLGTHKYTLSIHGTWAVDLCRREDMPPLLGSVFCRNLTSDLDVVPPSAGAPWEPTGPRKQATDPRVLTAVAGPAFVSSTRSPLDRDSASRQAPRGPSARRDDDDAC